MLSTHAMKEVRGNSILFGRSINFVSKSDYFAYKSKDSQIIVKSV